MCQFLFSQTWLVDLSSVILFYFCFCQFLFSFFIYLFFVILCQFKWRLFYLFLPFNLGFLNKVRSNQREVQSQTLFGLLGLIESCWQLTFIQECALVQSEATLVAVRTHKSAVCNWSNNKRTFLNKFPLHMVLCFSL